MDPLIPSAEARRSRLGGMSRQTLWRLHRDGEIAVVRIGQRVFLERSELDRFVNVRRERKFPTRDEAPAPTEASVEETADDGCDSSPE